MKSKVKILVALVVIVSLGLAACAGSQPAPSPIPPTEDLPPLGDWYGLDSQTTPSPVPTTPSSEGVDITGVWKRSGSSIFLQLSEDGTYAFADAGPDFLEKAPFETGQFRLEGTSLTFITGDRSIICSGGQTGSYQVELTEQGQLQFELKDDPCDSRTQGIPIPESWERVEP